MGITRGLAEGSQKGPRQGRGTGAGWSPPHQQKPQIVCCQRIGQTPTAVSATPYPLRVCPPPHISRPREGLARHITGLPTEVRCCQQGQWMQVSSSHLQAHGTGVGSSVCSPAGKSRPTQPCTARCDGFCRHLSSLPGPESPPSLPISFLTLHSTLWFLSPGTAALLVRRPQEQT